jgi:hypothetical protein
MNASPICSANFSQLMVNPSGDSVSELQTTSIFRPRGVEVPTQLKDISKPLGVICMHMREKDRIELLDWHADLR